MAHGVKGKKAKRLRCKITGFDRCERGDLISPIRLSESVYKEMKESYLVMVITVVDIVNGAAYLFDRTPDTDNQHWKVDLELEQFRKILK